MNIELSNQQLVNMIRDAQVMGGEEPDATLENLVTEEKQAGKHMIDAMIKNLNQSQAISIVENMHGIKTINWNDFNHQEKATWPNIDNQIIIKHKDGRHFITHGYLSENDGSFYVCVGQGVSIENIVAWSEFL